MDQIETGQLKKLSSEEYSPARSTGKTSQANRPTRSDQGQKGLAKDVFLSHSGQQKIIVRQLYRDLTNQGVSCFFDQDPESLPLAENFPSRIFEAVATCKVAVLLLSKDFLGSKWPMLELSAFVEARDITRTNPNLKILPLFFLISPDALKNTTELNEKWKQFEKSREERDKWEQALRAIRGINGLMFKEGDDEVEFTEKIVKEIWNILPTSPRYPVPCMQGEVRMCQEVADFFNKVKPNKKGIRIAGLYGIAGHGKTTLSKAFCNLKLGDFEGKVCHLEFSRGDSFEKIKLALQHLTHCPQSHLQTLTSQDQARDELYRRVKGQRVLLVLDNITDESIDEVRGYVWADFGENSCILLSGRSVDVLQHLNIDSQSCMRVPRLEEEEAIAILFGRTSPGESTLGAEDKGLVLKCASRCWFKETRCDIVLRARTFHPLALKAFGGYLWSRYGSNLSKWVAEIDGMADGAGDGLDEVFAVLCKAFDDMDPTYQTIFILLTVYMLPDMSPPKVTEWLAINCNEEIEYIKKAVKDLRKKAFIENFEAEIRIHDLYIEFGQSKAKRMGRWLWWKGDGPSTRGLISKHNAGFELVRLEQCIRSPSQIAPRYLQNLVVLQLISVQNMSKLDLSRMESLKSITLHNCKKLAALDGLEKSPYLAWLQIRDVNPMLKLPELSSLVELRYLEIDNADSRVLNHLGDLTPCLFLREIIVRCRSLSEFPRVNGLSYLEKVEFSMCDKVKGPLDCTECVELQSIFLNFCCEMAASPLLAGCKKLSNIVLWNCDAVMACPDVPSALKTLELKISSEAASTPKSLESCYGLENLQLWNMGELKELPSFRRLSNLTVLRLVECVIRKPPDLTSCVMLEDVSFFTLRNLERFPNFSLLKKLKKLYLYNCRRVQDPPDISGCQQLQVFHLVYNDKMEGLPNMDESTRLEEIKVSWHCKDEVTYWGIDPDSCEVDDDLESCLEHFTDEIFPNLSDVSVPEALKEWQWLKGKTTLVKRYFRGVKLYYSVTAPYESDHRWQFRRQATPECITLQIVDGTVVPFPTVVLFPTYKTVETDMEDSSWTETVRKYFAGKEDIVRASAASAIPPSPRYHVSAMQGEARMCQEVADFFNTVRSYRKGIRIVVLYGMLARGKTTLAKAFCNIYFGNFDGRVCYLDFCGGSKLHRLKLALQYLTNCRESQLKLPTREDEAQKELFKRVWGKRVLLVLDGIKTEESIHEVKDYLRANLGKNSCILLSAQSVDVDVLRNNFNIDSESCMVVPSLTEEEAIALLLERTTLGESTLGAEDRGFALKCANRCSFKEFPDSASTFHPFALKVIGRYLFSKHRSDLSKWDAEMDDLPDGPGNSLDCLSTVLEEAFDHMDPKYRRILVNLSTYCRKLSTRKVTQRPEKAVPKARLEANLDDPAVIASSPRYHVSAMQGEARMCQGVEYFFNTVHLGRKGIRIVVLYGMPGQGKTTLAKAFCNLKVDDFDGRVCYLDFCVGSKLHRLKLALQYLTNCPESQLKLLTREYEAQKELFKRVRGKRVLLVLDSIETVKSIDEVKGYLRADLGKTSCILLSTQSIYLDVLRNNLDINFWSCMRVPRLEEKEAIAILLERTTLEKSTLGAEDRGFALKCANRCLFKDTGCCEIVPRARTFHPLALKVIGRHLFSKHCSDLSKWVAEIDDLADRSGNSLDCMMPVLEEAMDDMDTEHGRIFMELSRYCNKLSSHKVTQRPEKSVQVPKALFGVNLDLDDSADFFETRHFGLPLVSFRWFPAFPFPAFPIHVSRGSIYTIFPSLLDSEGKARMLQELRRRLLVAIYESPFVKMDEALRNFNLLLNECDQLKTIRKLSEHDLEKYAGLKQPKHVLNGSDQGVIRMNVPSQRHFSKLNPTARKMTSSKFFPFPRKRRCSGT